MGTRAGFFIGDPRKETSQWLGCIAWDGHVENFLPELKGLKCAKEFAAQVHKLIGARDDFADPAKRGWPFPWPDDIFLNDVTYWWDGKQVCFAQGHYGPFTIPEWETFEDTDWEREYALRKLPRNVNIGRSYDRSAPDSIMIFKVPQ